MKRSIPILVFLLAAVLGTVGWLVLPFRSSAPRKPNIVLISIDTCRPDHLGCYGHTGQTTPHIDAFAREALLFSKVISPVPLTLPAHCSMLTGTIPPYHGVHDNLAYRLADRNVTLAERLREHGYATAAVIGAFVLDSRFGLSQGFDIYDDSWQSDLALSGGYPERRGEEVTQSANTWLDRRPSEPFFLFLHYFDPHHPYRPPAPFDSTFADDPYAGEIAYTDYCIGKVMDKLKSLGLYDSSLIVITADHGESLGEHGEDEHGYFIYHSTTTVPLLIKLPGRREGGTIDETVTLIDIVPTLLAQAGFPVPPDCSGKDLSPLLAGGRSHRNDRYIYSESMTATRYGCTSLLGVETDRWEYIQSAQPELYDLDQDPGETNNVAHQYSRQVRLLRERLKLILETDLRSGDAENRLVPDLESIERLRQLGYAGGPVIESFEFEIDKPDPKEFIKFYPRLDRLDLLVDMKQYGQARRLCAEILAQRRDIAYVFGKLGRMAMEQGRPDEAIEHFREALTLSPDSTVWHNNLGGLLFRKGQLDEAAGHFNEVLRLELAANGYAPSLDRTLAGQGRIDSPVFNAYLNLGATLLAQGEYAQAVEACRGAVQTKPEDPKAHYHLGVALSRSGRVEEAIDAYREALRLDPDHPLARRALDAFRGSDYPFEPGPPPPCP